MAGGRGLCAVEFDAVAAEAYRLNFPDTPVIERDIREVTAEEIMETAGLRVGELDVLDGSPPCQGFSTAGKRRMGDPRNDLFAEFVRLAEGLQPRAFVMENVSGLVKGKMRLLFREMMLALKATGYRVRCKLLDAKWFGVPQTRKRLIWVGARPDLGREPEHPRPTVERPVTVREAIGKDGWVDYRHDYSPGVVHWKRHEFDKPSLTVTKLGCGWKTSFLAEQSSNSSFGNQTWRSVDSPANTVTQGPSSASGYCKDTKGVERTFTIAEVKALCGFPQDFEVRGSFAQQWGLLGNSVPPLFMRAIAETVRDTLLADAPQEREATTEATAAATA